MGLGFVTSVDPTQGEQGVLVGNFLTMLGVTLLFATDSHHLVIAALNDSYKIFSPGESVASGDIAALATRAFAAAFRIGLQLSAPFLVFGLVFNIGLGVLARLMPQMQVYFVGVPLSIFAGFLILALVLAAMMGTFLDYFIGVMHSLMPHADTAIDGSRWPTRPIPRTRQRTRHKNVSTMRSSAATSPKARRSTPGSSSPAARS